METALEVISGEKIGRDPREMTVAELNALGHQATPLRKVIRAKCMDCSGENQAEVRKCTAVKCVLWPYRMNKNPFSEREGNPAALAALHASREARKAEAEAELAAA